MFKNKNAEILPESNNDQQDISKLSLVELITLLSNKHEADIIIYSGRLHRSSANKFVDTIENNKKKSTNAFLILSTLGGDPDAAYIIARYIKRTYKKFTLCIYGYCKSAGTLIALGADEIVMSCRGEFGPLDIQIQKEDELFIQNSGLDIYQALRSLNGESFNIFETLFIELKSRSNGVITTKTAGEIASSIAVGLLAPITSQIDPMKIGELQRAISIAKHYGIRLNSNSDLIESLIFSYPSHSFVIDYLEAKKLFGNVRELDEIESFLELYLIDAFEKQTGCDCIRNPHEEDPIILYLNPQQQKSGDVETNKNGKDDQNESHGKAELNKFFEGK